MAILNEAAIAAFTGLGKQMRGDRKLFGVTDQLMMGTNNTRLLKRATVKVPVTSMMASLTRQERRSIKRKMRKSK